MKYLNKYTILFFIPALFFSCTDEELLEKNNPVWETGVNGFGQFQSASALNFIRGDVAIDLDLDFRWISIDGKNTVEKVEFYVAFDEKYINKDGDPAVASHGKQLISTVDTPPDNRVDMSMTLTQGEIYTLFSSATFDYMEDGSAEDVFANPDKPTRDTSTQPFLDGDSFILTWVLTTSDGRVFDSWSPSACTELPGSNCELSWIVECGQIFLDPRGVYTIAMTDDYGDGWNGAAITVLIDGSGTDYTIVGDEAGLIDDGKNVTVDVNVPAGTTSLSFEFVSGAWDSEVIYSIKSENGFTLASATASDVKNEGPITVDLCKENTAPASTVP